VRPPEDIPERQKGCIVKPAHVAETEEEIHVTLSIPNRRKESDYLVHIQIGIVMNLNE